MSRNEITGDSLITKPASNSYRDGWDRIFGGGREPILSKIYRLESEGHGRAAAREITRYIESNLASSNLGYSDLVVDSGRLDG